MTIVNIHGILAREFGNSFKLSLPNPKDVLEAIDCNREGFLQRLVQLQKEGLCYDLIINKERITNGPDMDNISNAATIDLVPAISGSGTAIAMGLNIAVPVHADAFERATSLPYAGAELFQTSGTISGLPFSARDVTAGTVSVGTILTLQP